MLVREGHRIGVLTFLMVTSAAYGISLLMDPSSPGEFKLLHGNQGPGTVAVEVTGVREGEGIFFFPAGITLAEILTRLGMKGSVDAAGREDAPLSAGAALTVATCPEGGPKVTAMPAVKRLALGFPIDLNSASEEELCWVPGIGSKTASKISGIRQERGRFQAIEDLLEVPGIGEKKLASIKKYLTLERTH